MALLAIIALTIPQDYHVQVFASVNTHDTVAVVATFRYRCVGAQGEYRHDVQTPLKISPGNTNLEIVEPVGEPGRPIFRKDLTWIDLR